MKNRFEVSAASWHQVPAREDKMGWPAVLWRGLPETMSGWVVAMQPMGAFLLFVALVLKTKP